MTTIREGILSAFRAALTGVASEGIPGPVDIYRNRRAELTKAPALNMIDGGQDASDVVAVGVTAYTLSVVVEGLVKAKDDEGLGPALSDLYGATVRAVMADRTLGERCIDVTETALDVDLARGEGAASQAWFGVSFSISFWTAPGDPSAAA